MLHVLIVLRVADLKTPVAGTSILQEPDTAKASPDDDPLKANLTRITPRMDGLEIDDRLAVLFSPYDIRNFAKITLSSPGFSLSGQSL